MYKLYYDKLPKIFSMLEKSSDMNKHKTRQKKLYIIPLAPTERTRKTITAWSLRCLNVYDLIIQLIYYIDLCTIEC